MAMGNAPLASVIILGIVECSMAGGVVVDVDPIVQDPQLTTDTGVFALEYRFIAFRVHGHHI